MKKFVRGEILTAEKLNDALSGRRLTVAGDAATSYDADGDVVRVDGYSNIYIRLTSKTGTNPIKYAWTEVYRNTNGTWSNTTNNGTTTGDYAIELNNSNLSTSDNYVYRAERSPESGEWLFFLRRSRETAGTLNYRFTGTANSSLFSPTYSFQKWWFRTSEMTGNGTCPSGDFIQSQNSTYNNITFYYEYNNGTRSNLATFENNGTANSPIDVWYSANVTFPGKIGVDCVYYDGSVFGSYTNANSCVNGYSQQVTADTNANTSVTTSGSNISLAIPFTPALNYPTDDLAWPSDVTVNFNVTYGLANTGWPAGVQTAYNDWSDTIAAQLQSLSVGVNTPTKSCSGYTITHGRVTGNATHEFDITSNTCGSTKIRVWLESRTEGGAAAPYYFANSTRVNASGVNTELKYSFPHNGGGTVKVASNVTNGTVPIATRTADMTKSANCTLIKTWSANSTGNLGSIHQITVNFGYDDAGNCTAYQQTFTLQTDVTRT
jgi:hypothetical protein